jgi:hypothetical protein
MNNPSGLSCAVTNEKVESKKVKRKMAFIIVILDLKVVAPC